MIIKVHTVLAAQAGHDCGSEDMTGRVRLIVCTRGDWRIDSELVTCQLTDYFLESDRAEKAYSQRSW